MSKFYAVVVMIFALAIPTGVYGQTVQKCDGPPEMCAQIIQLQKDLDEQKVARLEAETGADTKAMQARVEEQKKRETRMKWVISAAATLSVILKLILSGLASWKSYFKTDMGKAWLKIVTIFMGIVAFISGNIGFGLPWWEAMILAGGGPAAMAVHSLQQLIPVIRGKAKYADPDTGSGTPSINPAVKTD